MLKSDRGNLRMVHMAVRWIMFVLVFVFQLAPAALQANPTGGEVVAGQAAIGNSGTTTTINQASQTAVINWQDFSINSGEMTKFIQPNASSAVLNKVIGNNVSQIYGTLEANGQVFLVNQSGIFVGASGVINTAGFVASTLDLDLDTFMKGGDQKFTGNSQASIVNLGNINGTNGVFLISQKIENAGKITSANGEVGLAAGSEVLLKQAGDERTSVLVGSSADGTGISNKGEIAAAVATMKATGSMYSVAVNNEGIVRAQGVNMSGGKVRLTGAGGTVINSGTLSAKTSDEKGGTVVVEGKNVGLIGNAVVDVSGKKGGGTALIGGDYQGSNPDVINAEKTFVGTGATIKADAEETGNGGKVIVWADSSTTYQGSLSAKGGSQSGNGGFAEVSGKEVLAFTGKADLGAANGSRGTLLLDPKNIIIDNAGAATLADVDAFTDTPAATSNINAATINAAVADVILQANTDITQNAGATITLGANISLTLQAGRSITLNDDITLTGTGAFTATINDAGADAGNRDAGLALFSMTAGSSITTAGGDVTVNVGTFGALQTGVVTMAGVSITTAGGDVTLLGNAQAQNAVGVNITSTSTISTGTGNLTITGTGGQGNNGVTMSAVTITGSGAVLITGTGGTGALANSAGVLLGNDTTITQTGTGSVTISGTAQASGGTSAGVLIEESDISVVDGNLQVTGTGSANGAGTAGNRGVVLTDDAGDRSNLSSSGTGTITITGARGAGTDSNIGVDMNGALVSSTGGGAILIQNAAGGVTTGSFNSGIVIQNDSDVTAVGLGSVTIDGVSGVGTNSNSGVLLAAPAASVTVVNGDLVINGTASAGSSGINNFGFVAQAATVQSTGTGLINITGTANLTGSNSGILLASNALINSATSNMTLTATNTVAGGTNAFSQTSGADITSTSGNISIIASGATTDYSLDGGGSSINAGSGNVSITADTVELAGVADGITTTGNVSIAQFTNGQLIDLGANTATRLALTSAELNEITANSIQIGNANSGNLLIAGAIAPTGTNTLILQTGGTNTITQGAAFTITETNLGLLAGTGAITLTEANAVTNLAANTAGNLTYTDATGVNIGSAATVAGVNTGTGAFTLNTNGSVTQTQALVSGNTTIIPGPSGSITLNDVNNAISGVLTLGATNISLVNSVATQFGTVSSSGSFSLTTADGNVTQLGGGSLNIGTTSTFNTGTGSITLNEIGNLFNGAIALTTTTATGDVQITNNATNTILAASNVGGDLIIVQGATGGFIGQTGALTVGGQASFSNLSTTVGDAFVDNTGAAGGTVLGAGSTTVAGDYTLAASAGGVTQTGAVRVNGTLTTTGGTTTLDRDDNILTNAASLSGGSIYFRKIGVVDINTDISGTINTGSGSLTIISLEDGQNFTNPAVNGNAVVLDSFANNFGGGLVVNTGGVAGVDAPVQFTTVTGQPAGINQNTATLTVGGAAVFRAVDGSDALNTVGAININGTNVLTGPISFTGQNATLINNAATNLAASNLTGNFSVTSTGNITNSGALNITGTSSFIGTTAGNTITVNNAGNLLTGAVSFSKTGAGNVILNNNQATVLGNVTTNGGNFSVTSNGTITQTGTITQNTGGVLNATTTAGDITLTSAANSILALGTVNSAGAFFFDEANGYNLTGNITATGLTSLGIQTGDVAQTGGVISSNGLVVVQGSGAGTSTVTLDSTGNSVGTLAASDAGTLNLRYVSSSSYAIDTVNGTAGISALNGSVRLEGTGVASVDLVQGIAAVGNIVINTAAGGVISNSGGVEIVTDAGSVYLRSGSVGTASDPILISSATPATSVNLTARGLTGGVFISNVSQGNLNVVTFDPSSLLDTTPSDPPSVPGIVAAGAIELRNTGVDGGISIDTLAGSAVTSSSTVVIENDGALTQTFDAVTGVSGGSIQFEGSGNIGTVATELVTSAPTIIFNKSGGDSIVDNQVAAQLQGSTGGDLTFETLAGNVTINASNLVAAGLGRTFEIIGAIQIVNGGGFIDMNGGDLSLVSGQIGAGVDLEVRDVGTLAAQATTGQLNINHAYNSGPLTGNVLTVGSVTGLTSTVNGLSAVGALTLDQVAENSIVIANTAAVNDVQAGSNISIVVAASPSGPDQLIVQSGAAITSGAGNAGAITIRGGVNNQGALTAGAGTTILLDGGRPDLILGGSQTYNGSVTFQANDDIIVTGIINQTGSGAVTQFLADFNNDGAGGFLLTDDVDVNAGIFNLVGGAGSSIVIEGSNLVNNTFAGGIYGGSIGNGVVIEKADAANAIQINNSGSLSLTSKDPLTTDTNDIIIDGALASNGANGDVILISDSGIQMSRNVTAGRNILASNESDFIRTAASATLNAGNAINFAGAGNLGTNGVVGNSQGALLTNAALLNFDSAGTTKAGATAFISELNAVDIEGSLAALSLIAGGTVADTANVLDIGVAQIVATTGSIILDTGHFIDEFGAVGDPLGLGGTPDYAVRALNGSFTYNGLTDLQISGTVAASSSSGIITINVDGFNLQQDAGAIIAGNRVNLIMSTGTLGAEIRDTLTTTAQNASTTITTTGGPGVVLTRINNNAIISTDLLTVNGTGSVGNDLTDGLLTDADALVFTKDTGDLYVFEDNTLVGNVVNTIAVSGDIGLTTGGTLNVSTQGTTQNGNITLGAINAVNGSNIHLIATSGTANATITRTSGSIAMSGGELLLVGRQGIGTKAGAIITEGTYELAAENTGTNGGIYIQNDGAGDIIISDITAFTPADQDNSNGAVDNTFRGVLQASTGNTGAAAGNRNIRIVNNEGDIRIGDRVQTSLANQQILLVANQADGQILQEDNDGVINVAGGQLYLLADSGIGVVNNAVRTSGTFSLAGQSSDDSGGNIGGIYLVNVGTGTQANAISASGTVTIGSFGETGGGFATLSGLTTFSPGADADIRLRNTAGATSNIVVDNIVQTSVNIGGNTIALIADNGAILQGGVNGRIVSDTDGVNPGEVLLAASQGIGTLANALVVQGHYNLGVRNDTLGFTTGTVTGNINILNNALGPISGFGNITVTNVNDIFAGAGVNAAILPVVGGLNTADTANSGAIRITNTNLGSDAGDIIVAETTVQTTGTSTGTAFINLVASDDILIGTTGQVAATAVNTQNGAITLTAANSNDIANDADANDGIVVVGDVTNVTAVVANGTAGVITMSAITDAFADVTVHSALVQANGTIAGNAVIVSANDDILIGNAAQETLSILQTINGGISLTAVNASVGDNADGILIQASDNALGNLIDDVFIQAQGANGAMSITASANTGILTVNGGDDNGAQAVLTSDQGMTVNADTIVVTAGNGNNALARLDAGTTQTVTSNNTANVANAITISGGAGPGTGANAGFTAGGNQSFTIAQGDLVMNGGAAQNNRALIETTAGTQAVTITGTGDIFLNAGSGQNADARIRALTAATSQTVTVNDGNLTLTAGSDATNGGDASIIYSATAPGLQTVTVSGDTGLGLIQLNGGTGAAANALIDSNTVQTVTAESGLDLNGGLGAGTNSSARIFANDSQTITVLLGDITMDGGTALQNRADIETTNGVQLVQITGEGNLTMTGGTGEEADARIRASNTATSQTVDLADGNLVLAAGNNAANGGDAIINFLNAAGTVQTVDVNGTITLTAASATASEGDAAFNSNTRQTVIATGDITLNGGGAGTTNSDARFVADNAQSVRTTTGNLSLLAGNGANADAFIRLTNTVAGADQTITVDAGNLIVTADQDAAANNSDAFIEMLVTDVTSDQTINVILGSITVTAGAGNNERAFISSEGNQNIDAETGITVQGYQAGATGSNSTAFISQNLAAGAQSIDVNGTAANLTVLGGRGTNGVASITALGLTQDITVSDGALFVRGNQTVDATVNGSALVSANNVAAVQTINVTNGGIIVEGGADATETAAIQMNGANGRQSISALTAGSISVLGGAGDSSSASILSAGINSGFNAGTGAGSAQLIIVQNGNLTLNAGNATNGESQAFILASNTGEATQFIDVDGAAAGIISIIGGGGLDEDAFIQSNGMDAASVAGVVSQSINALNGLTILGGTGGTDGDATNSTAGILANGNFGQQSIVVQNNNLSVLGGTGENASAFIQADGVNNVALRAQSIVVSNGNLIVSAGDATNGQTQAFILASNAGDATQFIDVDGAGGGIITILGGAGLDEDAFIRSNGMNTASVPTVLSQDINALNGITILGGSGGTDGDATNSTAGILASGLFGQQLITVQNNNLSVLGGSGENASAFVQADGINNAALRAQSIVISNGNLIVNAGDAANGQTQAFILASNTGDATQFIDVDGAGGGIITILGGAGLDEDAFIRSNGMNTASVPTVLSQDINALNGITILGGSGGTDGDATNSTAGILASGLFGQQLITVQNNNLSVLGGSGENASAFVQADGINNGLLNAQSIVVSNGNLIVNAGDGANGQTQAFILASNGNAATQFIDVDGATAGLILIQAGGGVDEDAFIRSNGMNTASVPGVLSQNINSLNGITITGGSGGTDGDATNSTAGILADGNFGQQSVVVQNNNLALIGGTAENANAFVQADGLNNGVLNAQSIIVSNGNLVLDAGNGANGQTQVFILATNAGAATQSIDVDGASGGLIILQGGGGADEDATIESRGFNAAAGVAQDINALNGITITGGLGGTTGAGTNSTAGFLATGLNGTQNVTVQNNNLSLLGGQGEDADAFILAAGLLQNITVSNGNLLVTADQSNAGTINAYALINSTNNGVTQTILVSGAGAGTIQILGGVGTTETAGIQTNGIQAITAANGINVTGGSGQDSTAFIVKQGDANDTQTITVTTGNFNILSGTGVNADARVASNGVTQTINVNNGALTVIADQTNAGSANADAIITATNAAAVQTLNVTNGGIIVRGGIGSTELATISMTGASGRQTINLLTDGDFVVEGGNGEGSAALITSAGINGGGSQAQRIIIDAGQLIVRGNQDAANGTGSATISQTSTAANTTQFIQVGGTTGTDGRITVLGGAGTNDTALISSTGRGTPAQQITAATDLTVQGGTGTTATAGITHAASILGAAANGQTITIGGNLLVQGGSGADAAALIQGNRNQTITVTGTAAILADTDGANGGGSATIFQQSLLNVNQVITVNGAGANALVITGGAGAGDSAGIDKTTTNGNQVVTVTNGSLTVNGGSGLAVADNYGRIRSVTIGSQTINVADSGTIVLNGNQGSSNDAAIGGVLTNYGAAIVSSGNQIIGNTSGGAITLNGGNDTGAAALIGATVGTQTITARGPINVNAGSADQTSAQIRSLIQQQTITANGDINVTGNATAATDNFAIIRSGLGQSITTTAGGNLIITANASSSSGAEGTSGAVGSLGAGLVSAGAQSLTIAGRIDVLGGSQDNAVIDHTGILQGQTITAGGTINLADGSVGDAVISSASLTVGGQQITATGSINLTADEGNEARIFAANNQTITTADVLNLSGITVAGGQALIQGGTSQLNINGAGASTWSGIANYVASTQATINNNGAIVVNEQAGFTGGVTAPVLVFVTGLGTVGSTTGAPETANTRLNTFVDEIFFNGVGTKTVNISEDNDVDLRGTIGTVNLIVDNAGNITTDIAALAGTNATFQTFDGDVDLDGFANSIANFQGVVARDNNVDGTGGNFSYLGAANTTVLARAVSAEIAAGQDIFATNTITMDVGGNTIFLAGGTKIAGTAPGAGDGTIFSGGDQTYQSAIRLTTDYLITSDGSGFAGTDNINFNGTIDGVGGLGIGSTPNFNNNVGATVPLAYLFLNSPVTSNFNFNNGLVVTNGSIVNQGGGNLNVVGNNMIFVVDNGTVGPGPGIFSGGNMTGGGLGSLTIFAPDPASVTGSALPGTQNFLVWNGNPGGAAILPPGFGLAVNFKAPPPPDDIKDKKNKRKDIEGDFTVSYEEGVNAGTMVTVSGIPLAEPATVAGEKVRTGGLLTTSYGVNSPSAINTFYFGRDVQAPIQLETDKLVNGPKGSPNRN